MNYFASKSAPPWTHPKPPDGNAKSRLRPFEIWLPSLPKRYECGDGPPPLAPLSMILKNDSTARILDRRVMCGPPKNNEISLQLYYVVGWLDLPAARVAIQAQQIHEYVSPREVEDFEYKLYLEREAQEEAEDLAAAIEAVDQAEAAENAILRTKPATSAAKGKTKEWRGRKRRRQRPSKADLIAKKQAEETSFNKSEAAAMSGALATSAYDTNGPSLTAPSLSTPKKKHIPPSTIIADSEDQALVDDAEAEAEADDRADDNMELDDDDAILRQLHQTSMVSPDALGAIKSETRNSTPGLPPASLVPTVSDLANTSTSAVPTRITLQHYGFTPAAKSTVPWPVMPTTSQSTSSAPLKIAQPSTPLMKSEKKKPQSRKKKDLVNDSQNVEEVWEVKCLEGVRIDFVDGKRVREFKVRWKGNWPPDQNPTWEPEENIDKPLIRKYLAKRSNGSEQYPGTAPQAPPLLKRKYSSVAEAVMGEAENEREHRSPALPSPSILGTNNDAGLDINNVTRYRSSNHANDSPASTDDDDNDDILQVTDPGTQHEETPFRNQGFNDALMRELETSFRRQDVRRSSEGTSASAAS
ncbi:chromobox protein 5 [Microdochium nivale]|nr:chromobox protein 5 [Microdochium nivale]